MHHVNSANAQSRVSARDPDWWNLTEMICWPKLPSTEPTFTHKPIVSICMSDRLLEQAIARLGFLLPLPSMRLLLSEYTHIVVVIVAPLGPPGSREKLAKLKKKIDIPKGIFYCRCGFSFIRFPTIDAGFSLFNTSVNENKRLWEKHGIVYGCKAENTVRHSGRWFTTVYERNKMWKRQKYCKNTFVHYRLGLRWNTIQTQPFTVPLQRFTETCNLPLGYFFVW